MTAPTGRFMICCAFGRVSSGDARLIRVWWYWIAKACTSRPVSRPTRSKKVSGRKRGLAVDVFGLVIAVVVMAASAHDHMVVTALLDRVAAAKMPGTVRTALVDLHE